MEETILFDNFKKGSKISWKEYRILESKIPTLVFAYAHKERYNFTKNPVTLLKACEFFKNANDVRNLILSFKILKSEHPKFVRENHIDENIINGAEDDSGRFFVPTISRDTEFDNMDISEEQRRDENYIDFLEDSMRFGHINKKQQNEIPSSYYDYPYLESEDGFNDSY